MAIFKCLNFGKYNYFDHAVDATECVHFIVISLTVNVGLLRRYF